ncbi:FAD:protein FMN transferase [Microbacterium sp. LRZ72]|uniref:FAD:protein FMN transferase n=1 Tax=Microbacterium sp. LRZ72 TaxID=2942481 RepID=UPI0029A51B67|nr:FAD:protein FMN transferase [Microbacterium sp. LRZ72]MDX2375841.1 FAD:protein FMN transferase [Microbacterium sp. LRZ72]
MPRAVWEFDAIGTRWRIETVVPLDGGARDVVDATIEGFDRAWSRFRADSLVTRLARGAGTMPAPPDAAPMLELYRELAAATSGAVNPLVGGPLAGLGYDENVSLAAGAPSAAPEDWEGRLRVEHGRLHLDGAGTIDVGALGKGRLVDLVLAALPAPIGADAVVDAGGDLAARGAPQRIGLEHPHDASRAIGVWRVENAALCASGVNRRAWGDGLHHVLDARTGVPVRTVVATWAVAPEAMRADAAATALFFDGGAELAHRWEVAWVRMLSDGRVEFSPGCEAELFTRTDSVRR